MTPESVGVAQVDVIQADRDAVQEFHQIMLLRLMSDVKSQRPKLGEDEGDAGTLVQAFARHRLTASTEAERAMREALEQCVTFIRMFKNDGAALLGEGVHTGLRKGTDADDAAFIWRAIDSSKTTAWKDATDFAHDPFLTMWGGDKALAAGEAALALPSDTPAGAKLKSK